MNRLLILTSLFFIFSFLTYTPVAEAVGVSPSRHTIEFEPNFEDTFTFSAINNGDTVSTVELYLKGPQSQYMTLSDTKLTIQPQQTAGFQVTVKLPASIEKPGIHDNRIGVLESAAAAAAGGGASVAVRTGVEAQIWVKVPYPGKYLEAGFDPLGTHRVGDTVNFVLQVTSLGTEATTGTAAIEVYSGSQKVATLDAGSATLQPGETKALSASWSSVGHSAGKYRALAIISFEGTSTTTEAFFNIGDLIVNIVDIDTSGLKKGSISKVSVGIESLWNEPLQNVFADITVLNKNGAQLATAKTPSQEVPANSQAKLETFLDLTSVKEDEGDLRVVVSYADKTAEKTVPVSLVGAPTTAPSAPAGAPNIPLEYILVGVGAAAAVGIAVFLKRRRPQ